MNTTPLPLDFPSVQLQMRTKWPWFVAIGFVLIALAALAFGNLILATTVTMFYLGAMMVVGGAASILHSFQIRGWSGFDAWFLSGLLYAVSGLFVLSNPLLAAATLTLLFAIALIVSGVMRLWSGFQLRFHAGRMWMIASGLITLLTGLVFILGWPVNSLFLLGMLLALDLAFQGVSAIMFGLLLKSD